MPENEITSPKSINANTAPIAGFSEKINPLILGPLIVYDLNRKVSPMIRPIIPLIPSIAIWYKEGILIPSITIMVTMRKMEAKNKRMKFSIKVPILLAILVKITDVNAHRTAVARAKNSPINIYYLDISQKKRRKIKKFFS